MTRPVFEEQVEIRGEGLVLRDWREDDVPLMPALFDDPDIAYWTPLHSPFDEEAASNRLKKSRENRAEGKALQLAITLDGDDAPLGEVLLMRTGHPEGVLEIGYAVGPAHRGQGLAARAVRVMTAYAFAELGADQVVLELEAENAASVGVARATGFRLLDVPLIPGTEKGRSFELQTWGQDRP
ncbi:GNAT family N-acetyltransferase [Streptomyces sp. NPDC051940]|uniref:GNAT family N-acetyltransferase n=1 Tax=Streptomyces sp. NPDC051940 TaxID=3155675 RepID=UPI00344076FB